MLSAPTMPSESTMLVEMGMMMSVVTMATSTVAVAEPEPVPLPEPEPDPDPCRRRFPQRPTKSREQETVQPGPTTRRGRDQ